MAQNVTAGYGVYANYGYEASMGAGAVSARTFGRNVKVNVQRKNNTNPIMDMGSRNATSVAALKYEGTVDVEFDVANGSFWRQILGTVADTGAGPYTHTYTEANSLPTFAIDTGSELGTNDEVTELKGCVVNTATISAKIGEIVNCKLNCLYQTEVLATSGIGSQVAETFDVFTFAHGTLEIPTSTTIAYVQDFELTIDEGLEFVWGLGSRLAVANVAKHRQYNVKFTLAFSSVAMMQAFYGSSTAPDSANYPAETATLKLTFTNGLASTSLRDQIISLTNFNIDMHTLNKNPTELIKEGVTGFCRAGTSVVWHNNTAVDAGAP